MIRVKLYRTSVTSPFTGMAQGTFNPFSLYATELGFTLFTAGDYAWYINCMVTQKMSRTFGGTIGLF